MLNGSKLKLSFIFGRKKPCDTIQSFLNSEFFKNLLFLGSLLVNSLVDSQGEYSKFIVKNNYEHVEEQLEKGKSLNEVYYSLAVLYTAQYFNNVASDSEYRCAQKCLILYNNIDYVEQEKSKKNRKMYF